MYDPPGYFLASSQILDRIAVPQHNHGKKWCYGSSRDHLDALTLNTVWISFKIMVIILDFPSQDLP